MQPPSASYESVNRIADPIYKYIAYTKPADAYTDEVTESDILDTAWLQRMRFIHQLQAAWWVFPAGEHSRLQHCLGAMHLAGEFVRHLYPSLRECLEATGRPAPSPGLVEETLRMAGLLHDVGHGPFGHQFDEYLEAAGHRSDGEPLTHEHLSQQIIRQELADRLRQLRRSPSPDGAFADGEAIEPEHVCYLIRKGAPLRDDTPQWVRILKPLLTGVYTVDNLDFVRRDAYMCGVSLQNIDVERLKYYTFVASAPEDRLCLHGRGLSALELFLQARHYMYANVYLHRAGRAIEIHLSSLLPRTMRLLFPRLGNPAANLRYYLEVNDWSLLNGVAGLARRRGREAASLANEWGMILQRRPKWNCVWEWSQDFDEVRGLARLRLPSTVEFERGVRRHLPPEAADVAFAVDLVTHDIRPAADYGADAAVPIWNPNTRQLDDAGWRTLTSRIPAQVVIARVFCRDGASQVEREALRQAAGRVLRDRAAGPATSQ